jgi:hypothetical protein
MWPASSTDSSRPTQGALTQHRSVRQNDHLSKQRGHGCATAAPRPSCTPTRRTTSPGARRCCVAEEIVPANRGQAAGRRSAVAHVHSRPWSHAGLVVSRRPSCPREHLRASNSGSPPCRPVFRRWIRTGRGEVRWRDEGELLHGPSAAPTGDPILTRIGGSAPWYPALSQLARHRGCRRNVLSREVRRHPGRLRVLDLRLRVVAHPSGRCRPGLFWLTSARSSVALLTGRVTPGSMTAQMGEEHR